MINQYMGVAPSTFQVVYTYSKQSPTSCSKYQQFPPLSPPSAALPSKPAQWGSRVKMLNERPGELLSWNSEIKQRLIRVDARFVPWFIRCFLLTIPFNLGDVSQSNPPSCQSHPIDAIDAIEAMESFTHQWFPITTGVCNATGTWRNMYNKIESAHNMHGMKCVNITYILPKYRRVIKFGTDFQGGKSAASRDDHRCLSGQHPNSLLKTT